MNMNALMAQARKLQTELEKTTKDIESKKFVYENENIDIEATGNNHITKVEIKNEDVLQDKEILEDIITVGVNGVLNQIKKEKDDKLGKYAGGLGGMF